MLDVNAPVSMDQLRAAEREAMVTTQVERRGVVSPSVLAAMRSVPREHFVPNHLAERAYADGALPIDCDQTISQPFIVARMTELLELTPEDRVLEIGTGTGYQTAILACLAARVYTIEWHLKLLNDAAARLDRLGLPNVVFRCADGSLGWPERATFDAIMVTAGAPDVPAPLTEQLAEGGRLVAPIGPIRDQTLVLVRRTGQRLEQRAIFKCRFVKLCGAAGWRE